METLYVKDFLNGGTLDKRELSRQLTVLKHEPGVYIIENAINGRKYIGSSKNLYKRILDHLYNLNRQKHRNILLNNNCQKYGLGVFEITVINTPDYADLEEYYLSLLNPDDLSINRNYSGGDVISSHPLNADIRLKISAGNKLRYQDPSYLKNHSESRIGHLNSNYKGGISYPRCPWPKPEKKDISGENNPFYGKSHTPESKKAMSLAKVGKPNPLKGKPSMSGRKLQCGDKCFYTITAACDYFGRSHIWVEGQIRRLNDWFFVKA